ncbi:hypothetical protein ACT3R5_15935 [Glutamicibacter sp. AOP5-A2-7]
MPSWVHDLLQIERLFTIALIFFIVYLLLKTIGKNWKFVSNFVRLVNTLVGDDKNPGIGVRMEQQTKKLDKQAELLERVRAQVENDHDTNFRDDNDLIMEKVDDLATEFKAHVAISKAKDKEGDENAYRVAVLADKVNKIQPIVEQLGKTWGEKTRNN